MASANVAAKKISQTFTKYTVQPKGIWASISKWMQIDSTRSSGVPLNPLFRNPQPGGDDPTQYQDPVTVPAADLAENPYWKRDMRRSYPQLSVVTQGDVVGLLTVGSKAAPRDDILQIGDAGSKQLVALKDEGKAGLPAFFQKDEKSLSSIMGPGGLPPLPANLRGANGAQPTGLKYKIQPEQSYTENYPCRNFA